MTGERRDQPPRVVRAGLGGDVRVLADGEEELLGARQHQRDGLASASTSMALWRALLVDADRVMECMRLQGYSLNVTQENATIQCFVFFVLFCFVYAGQKRGCQVC